MNKPLSFANRTQEVLSPASAVQQTWTISQVITYFASYARSNYPRIARQYLEFCFQHGYGIDPFSAGLFTAGKKGNIRSPIKKFLHFATRYHINRVVADSKKEKLPPAVNAWVLAYLADAKTLRGEQSPRTYLVGINAFYAFAAQEKLSLGGYGVEQFVRHLRKETKSVFTINSYLSAIKQFSKWLLNHRHHPDLRLTDAQVEALRDVDTVKGFAPEQRFYKEALSGPEREQLLSGIADLRGRAMVALMAFGGLRTVELVRLQVNDVDVKEGHVQVLGKGKAQRELVKLPTIACQVLEEYLRTVATTSPKTALFPNLTTGQIRYHMGKYLRQMGLKRAGISAHSLRHTAAQRLLKAGVEPLYVQRHLRHKQFATTQLYLNRQVEQDYETKVYGEPGRSTRVGS